MAIIYLCYILVTLSINLEVMDQIQDEGDTASFTCQATGGPVPTITWYLNGTPLADGVTHTILKTSVNITTINSTLTIMSVESSDVGTYTCNATNVVSSDTSSGVLTVNGESREVCMNLKIRIVHMQEIIIFCNLLGKGIIARFT